MEQVLRDLNRSLRAISDRLKADGGIQSKLHNSENLPELPVYQAANEALDLLSELRLLLEPGHLVLADHFLGYMRTKCLCAAVELNIPDILASGPKSLQTIAEATGSRPDRLGQIMRTLRNEGVYNYNSTTQLYSNNHVSDLLQKSHPTQWCAWVNLYGNEFYDMTRGIPQAMGKDTVRSPAQVNYDTDDSMFKYFTQQGWISKLHRTLSSGAIAQAPGILEDYPWTQVADCSILDIGGGGGGLIALLLRKHKMMRGAIVDLPEVIEHAKDNFHSSNAQYHDVGDRVPVENLIPGNFLEEVPSSEVYTMKWCLHDWNDEKAMIILRNIRRSIQRTSRSRLVILESVLRDGHVGRISRYGDLNMMVAVGGHERDEDQWRELAARTGWRLQGIYSLRNAWPSAIEFVPVWDNPQQSGINGNEKEHIVATMRFLEPWDVSRGNPYIRVNPAEGFERMNFNWQDYPVTIRNARPIKGQFDLNVHGFSYQDDEVSQELIQIVRSNDREAIKRSYYPQVESLIKKVTGAKRVIIFDHTQRKRRLELDQTKNEDGKEQPATMVHCDQSEKGALKRLKTNISETDNIDELLKGRVQMINVWRPLIEPVRDWPLATMDYQSTSNSDMYPCDLLTGKYEERGQTVTFTHTEAQKWFYLEKQTTSEVTLIKIWDNKSDASQFCAHAAFNHPNTPLDVQARESVEVRCFALDA